MSLPYIHYSLLTLTRTAILSAFKERILVLDQIDEVRAFIKNDVTAITEDRLVASLAALKLSERVYEETVTKCFPLIAPMLLG